MHSIKDNIYKKDGYDTSLSLSIEELKILKKIIRDQYLNRIKKYKLEYHTGFKEKEMNSYHELSHLIDHKEFWPKNFRCLNQKSINRIKKFSFMSEIKSQFGEFYISDEDNIGREEIYWRLVRPENSNDVGPLHADVWFWELNYPKSIKDKRIKVWIPIFCDVSDTGFRFLPNSHKESWNYEKKFKDGKYKPIFEIDESKIKIEKFKGKPGDIIIFNDRLLHGGYTTTSKTRVSLELTIIIK